MEGYNVKINYASRELTAKERVAIKDTSNAISLDEATKAGAIEIDYDYNVILGIHNENYENKDYTKTVLVAKDGGKFVTGSEAFTTALTAIVDEMVDAGEGDAIKLSVYKKDSKKYSGKQFITVSLI